MPSQCWPAWIHSGGRQWSHWNNFWNNALLVSWFPPAREVGAEAVPHCHIPSRDLSVVLTGLQRAPFEPLESDELNILYLKTALLTALTSIKRVGDLQAFSVHETCLEFGLADSLIILRPRPGYVPKVPTTPFQDQVMNLQTLPLEEADSALVLLCHAFTWKCSEL